MTDLHFPKKVVRAISGLLIFSIVAQPLTALPVRAAMISTETAIETPTTGDQDRQRLIELLRREDAARQLESYGIDADEAIRRINSLTAAEVSALAEDLNSVPAGAGFYGGGTCTKCYTGSAGAQLAFVGGLILILVLLFYFLSGDETPVES